MLALHENALITALQTHRDVMRLLRTMESLPKLTGKELLQKYLVDAPALYVVPGRFSVKDDDVTLEFTVAGVIRNVAGQAQARKGDGIDIGCDHLMILATRALHNQHLGQCSWSLVSGEMVDDEVFEQAGISAIELKFVGTPIPLPEDYGEEQIHELADFTRFHADIDLPPTAGAIEYASWMQTPPDFSTSRPDAQLDIQLPGAS
jgi:hypothetical protein